MRPDLACRGDFGGPLLEVVTVIERLASDCGDEVLSGRDGPDMSMSHGLGFWRDDATNTVPRLVNDAGVRFDCDDTAAVLLHFRKGALGTILISESTPSPWSWEGSVSERLGFHNAGRDTLRSSARTRPSASQGCCCGRTTRPTASPAGCRRSRPGASKSSPTDPYADQLVHFARAIRGLEQPVVTGGDGLRSLAVAVAVSAAARRGWCRRGRRPLGGGDRLQSPT